MSQPKISTVTKSREHRIADRAAEHVRAGASETVAVRAATAFVDAQDAFAREDAWNARLAEEQARIDTQAAAEKADEERRGEAALDAHYARLGELGAQHAEEQGALASA